MHFAVTLLYTDVQCTISSFKSSISYHDYELLIHSYKYIGKLLLHFFHYSYLNNLSLISAMDVKRSKKKQWGTLKSCIQWWILPIYLLTFPSIARFNYRSALAFLTISWKGSTLLHHLPLLAPLIYFLLMSEIRCADMQSNDQAQAAAKLLLHGPQSTRTTAQLREERISKSWIIWFPN